MGEQFEARIQKLENAKGSEACYESYCKEPSLDRSAALFTDNCKNSKDKDLGGFTTIHDTEKAAPMDSDLQNNLDRFAHLV